MKHSRAIATLNFRLVIKKSHKLTHTHTSTHTHTHMSTFTHAYSGTLLATCNMIHQNDCGWCRWETQPQRVLHFRWLFMVNERGWCMRCSHKIKMQCKLKNNNGSCSSNNNSKNNISCQCICVGNVFTFARLSMGYIYTHTHTRTRLPLILPTGSPSLAVGAAKLVFAIHAENCVLHTETMQQQMQMHKMYCLLFS